MQLVLIDHRKRIVKVYEEHCSEDDIDTIFNEYLELKRAAKKVRPQVLPSVTFVGTDATSFFQGQFVQCLNEWQYRQELEKKSKAFLKTKAVIWGNHIKRFGVWCLTKFLSIFKSKSK